MKKLILICIILALPKFSFANERSIPLELFTAKKIQHSGKLKITGPIDWKNKRTDEILQVYQRKRGSKIQLFAKTNNGQCLGRVMDSRYEKRGLVYIKNGCKFPLGNWKEGEKREFVSTYFYNNKSRDYKKTITIKKIGNEKKCLTFRWSKAKLDGKMIDDNTYTYCPKKGFTKIVSHKSGKMSMTLSGNMKATGTK